MYEFCSSAMRVHFRVLKYDFHFDYNDAEHLVKVRKCSSCTFETASKLFYSRHLCAKKQFKCVECARVLTTKESLRKHMKTQHLASLHKKWLKCGVCNYKYQTNGDLQKHLRKKHTSAAPVLMKCEFCDYQSADKYNFKIHTLRRHSVKDGDSWLLCQHCDYKTKVPMYIRQHIKTRHRGPLKPKKRAECHVCNITMNKKSVKLHMLRMHTPDKERFKCEFCEKTYSSKHSIVRHIERQHSTATDKSWYQCEHCSYKTMTKSNLNIHNRRMHSEGAGASHSCSFCDYKTFGSSSLKRHIVRKHTKDEDIQWFNCNACDYKAKLKCLLRSHIENMHQMKKEPIWVECSICEAKFRWKASLQTHMFRNHSSELSGKLSKCLFCDYEHIHKGLTERHMKATHIDHPVECQYCHVMCRNEETLKAHMRHKKHITIKARPRRATQIQTK